MASTRLGRYEIVKTLARGALSDLLLARSTGMEGFQRYVAIKQLRAKAASDPACVESFVSEARLAAVLHHHNIVQVHDIGEEGGQPYFAMEYVHGVDLRTLLARLAKRNEQLPLQHVVSIVGSAAAALHHAHEQRAIDGEPLNIVHRDVTPGNILVGFDGNVKVVDFGIAKAAIKRIQTDAAVIKGQAPYMSPEQCAGKPIDRRSDVFALGIVLYELATVRRLFKGASEFLTMSAVCNAEVPRPSQYRRDIPPQLEAIMLKALSRDPNERFQTAGEMSLALDRIASTVGVGASTTALANYMRLQFGDQKEPWLVAREARPVDDFDGEVTDVDFDGPASGLAPPPSESIQKMALPRAISASKDSPIAAARTHAITPPAPAKAQLPLPPPSVQARTRPPPVPDDSMDGVPTSVKRISHPALVDAHAPTELNPALAQAAAYPSPDATAIVEPLPVGTAEHPAARPRSRRALWLALFSLVVGGATVATVVFWPGAEVVPAASGASPEPAPAAPSRAAAEPAPQEPVAEPAPEPSSEPGESALEMTHADYERERAKALEGAGAAEPAAESAVGATREPPRDEPAAKRDEPVATRDEPAATRVPAKPPAKRRAAKAAAKVSPAPKKPASRAKKRPPKPPTWDPDDLFLDEK